MSTSIYDKYVTTMAHPWLDDLIENVSYPESPLLPVVVPSHGTL